MSDSRHDLFVTVVCLAVCTAGSAESRSARLSPSSFGDHFEWNKVTSCIHNILSGQRWIEHYGEIVIKNRNDDSCHCKVNFTKVSWWPWELWPGKDLRAQGVLGNFSPLPLCHQTSNARGSLVPVHLCHLAMAPPGLLPSLWSVLSAAAMGSLLKPAIVGPLLQCG